MHPDNILLWNPVSKTSMAAHYTPSADGMESVAILPFMVQDLGKRKKKNAPEVIRISISKIKEDIGYLYVIAMIEGKHIFQKFQYPAGWVEKDYKEPLQIVFDEAARVKAGGKKISGKRLRNNTIQSARAIRKLFLCR